MKPYNLEDSEKDMLKVIKYNQQLSLDVEKSAEALNAAYDCSIAKADETISKAVGYVGKPLPDVTVKAENAVDDKPISQVQPLSWDKLVSCASAETPYNISFEDILTSAEFDRAFRRLDEIEMKFSKATSLKGVDLMFLFTATALQCVRQYIIDPLVKKKRPGHEEADRILGSEKGKSDRQHGWYKPTSEQILLNPVPFDTTFGSPDFDLNLGNNHRVKTLGHDPILGWIFGTMNIVTSTITLMDFRSFHVKTRANAKGNFLDKINNYARTDLVASYTLDRFFHQGKQGKIDVGVAVGKEAIHLASDVISKKSLPIPIISSFAPDYGDFLSDYGIDMASVSVEAGISSLINALIGMTHGLFYLADKTQDRKLYEVRTRKVLLYSNMLASTSNVIAAVVMKNPKILDVGGLLVTISRLFADIRFICKVKQEFIDNELDIHFRGIADETERLYAKYNLT